MRNFADHNSSKVTALIPTGSPSAACTTADDTMTASQDKAAEHRRLRELLYQLHVNAGVSENTLLSTGLGFADEHGIHPYAVGRLVAAVASYPQHRSFHEVSANDATCIDGLSRLIETAGGLDRDEAVLMALHITWRELMLPAEIDDKMHHEHGTREQIAAVCARWEERHASWMKTMLAELGMEGA